MAADMLTENTFDLVLLDIMLPGIDGYDLLEYIMPTGTPVIFITAKGTLEDRVQGLRLGADDYIVKPFEPMELLARVEAVLRRAGKTISATDVFGLDINCSARQIHKNGKEICVTPREFDLLEILLRNRGIAMYRDFLYEQVWGGEAEENNRTLDLHILRLRKKLGWQKEIRTVFKVGYMLEKEITGNKL